MGSVYRRHDTLWIAYYEVDGRRVQKPTEPRLRPGQEDIARALLDVIEARVKADKVAGENLAPEDRPKRVPDVAPTLKVWFDEWSAQRALEGVGTAGDERRMIGKRVLPLLGRKRLDQVTVRDLAVLVAGWKAEGLAPRSVHTYYGMVKGMFRDAVRAEHIAASPCQLTTKRDLGRLRDKDSEWRGQAIYTRGELEQLVTDPDIEPRMRVLCALVGLAGVRPGEACGLTWGRYDRDAQPLGMLRVVTSYQSGHTKTESPRNVPVHPELARVLARWRLRGWAELVGRVPRSGDVVVPLLDGRPMHDSTGYYKAWRAAIDGTGMRRRRLYDLRRTFISFALADGAHKDHLWWVTHGTRRDILDVYTNPSWPKLCEQVACLNIQLERAAVVQLRAAGAEGASATVSATGGVPPRAVIGSAGGPHPGTGRQPGGGCLGQSGPAPPADTARAFDVRPVAQQPPPRPNCPTCSTAVAGAREALAALQGGDLRRAEALLRAVVGGES